MSVSLQSAIAGLAGTSGPNGALAVLAGSLYDRVRRVWPDEAVLHYIGASDRRRQVWNACLAQPGFVADNEGPLWPLLLRGADRDLLSKAFGTVPPGAPRALGKLGPIAVHPGAYRAVITLLGEGGAGAKLVRHADRLTERDVLAAVMLPPALRVSGIIKACHHPAHARQLAWYARRFEQLAEAPLPRDAAQRLQVLSRVSAMCEALQAHPSLEKLLPPPPYPAAGPIRPLRTVAEVAEAGRRFRNCIDRYSHCRDGRTVFYVYEDAEPAMIELSRITGFGWEISELKGVANVKVSAQTWNAILDWFADKPNVYVSARAEIEDGPDSAAAGQGL